MINNYKLRDEDNCVDEKEINKTNSQLVQRERNPLFGQLKRLSDKLDDKYNQDNPKNQRPETD